MKGGEMATTVIGQSVNRIDGHKKVTGQADYAADHHLDGLVHGYGVMSTIANGRVVGIDASVAQTAPGVLAVLHHGNIAPLYRSSNDFETQTTVGEVRPPFEDDRVYYAGQFVALVVAKTFEQARDAAPLVKVSYQEEKPLVSWSDDLKVEPQDEAKRGNPDEAFAHAAADHSQVVHEATYWTPMETHNPIEMHGAVASWEGDRLTVYSSTQGVIFERNALAMVLGVPVDRVTVLSPYLGSGFGGKLFLWPHTVLAAVAAKQLQRPVKVSVTRSMMFTTVGHRPSTKQSLKLAATKDGTLTAIQHDTVCHTSFTDLYLEDCGTTTKALYTTQNLHVAHAVARVNRGTPTAMRAPGSAPGLYALESAMDELAIKLNMDPVELRLKNIAMVEQDTGKPWSSNHLHECLQVGAEKFGWSKRSAAPGSMKSGDKILGWGVAACSWPADRQGCSARVDIRSDGTVRASCATQDIGTGTYTVIAQVVSELTGLPFEKIEVKLGDTSLPPGPISGGSWVTATVTPAVAEATRQALKRLTAIAVDKAGPLANADEKSVVAKNGKLVNTDDDKQAGFAEILASRRLASLSGEVTTSLGDAANKFGFRSFGAHFTEVEWEPAIARLRVSRCVSVLDGGRIMNPKAARNQIAGAIVMGVGMAMFEETRFDGRSGRPINNNFADYVVSTNADTPQMDITFLDYPDLHLNEFGARGIGEIGLTGLAASVANAVNHATGTRVRELPITLDKLMA
jgi:xanthine dehydrogenase YagR molybdenum-binding subunit